MEKLLKHRILTLFAVSVLLIGSWTKSSMNKTTTTGGGPGPNEVWIQNMAFNPTNMTVAVGTTVKWTNKDAITHTVTSDTGSFDSGNLSGNGIYSFTFTTAGSYPYHCKIHTYMTATITVQ